MRRLDAALVVVSLAMVGAWLVLRRGPAVPEPAGRVTARATSSRPPSRQTPATPPPLAGRIPPPPLRTCEGAGLTVETDVPGADVFVDRVYKGQAPLTITGVAPGPHRLNVSAEGHDGYADTVEVTGQPQTVAVRLKQVRLDVGIDVVHKHGFGSCRGRLAATPAGLRFAASKPEDSFDVPLASAERLDADYLKKTLTVKLRGGRTYNFTEPAGGADALLSFEQAVTKARSRLQDASR